MDRDFEWDAAKCASNIEKHGVDFEAAKRVFLDFRVEAETTRPEHHERRWLTVGSFEGEIFAVVYTIRADRIRIISARRASHGERKLYDQSKRTL